MTDEERAALWREQFKARCEARLKRLLGLRGNPAARETLSVAWRPPLLAALEAEADDPFLCAPDPYPAEKLLP